MTGAEGTGPKLSRAVHSCHRPPVGLALLLLIGLVPRVEPPVVTPGLHRPLRSEPSLASIRSIPLVSLVDRSAARTVEIRADAEPRLRAAGLWPAA